MKGFISMGTLLFITLAVALTSLAVSVYSFKSLKEIQPVVNYLTIEPSPSVGLTVLPTVDASPSAAPLPTKKTTVPSKTVTPVVSVSPTAE